MKIKKLPYSMFRNLASKAGEVTSPQEPEQTNRNFMTITFEFFRVVGPNSYEESVHELESILNSDSLSIDDTLLDVGTFDWDSSSLGPYIDPVSFPSANIKIRECTGSKDFWYTTFPAEGLLDKLTDRYDKALERAEKIISLLPHCAFIATVKYQFDRNDCSYPLCVLAEEDRTPTNQEILKILI